MSQGEEVGKWLIGYLSARLIEYTPFAQKNVKGEIQGRYKVLFFSFMEISNATVTSKQNFIGKYHRLMKNIYFIFRLLFFTSDDSILLNLDH